MLPDSLEDLFVTILGHPMTRDCCFLCGEILTPKTKSKEDVIPKWVQRRFSLERHSLTLINRTSIHYGQIKVPCCRVCNNEHLSRLEGIVQTAVDKGYDAVRRLPKGFVFQWLAKIYVGLKYREIFLPANRADPTGPRILEKRDLDNVRILWLWMLSSLNKKSARRAPGSLWVFRCRDREGSDDRFDLMDDHHSDTMAVRMGEVGLIADFLDSRVHQNAMGPMYHQYRQLQLTPLQFKELATRIAYKAQLLHLTTSVSLIQDDEGNTQALFDTQSVIPGDDDFAPWDETFYISFLAHRLGVAPEEITNSDGTAKSWLHSPSGDLQQFRD